MADINKKVVTIESLEVFRNYDKENTYLTKADPTGTGTLSMNRKSDTVIGNYSVALGIETTSAGTASYAEGQGTIATANFAHVEGLSTVASAPASHAEGINTNASSECQHVQGRHNIGDGTGRYAHIIGNGKYEDDVVTHSNAHTVDWNGNAWYQGEVYVGGTNQDDAEKLVKSTNVVSIEYGDTLPEAGTVGRIFFKRVTE